MKKLLAFVMTLFCLLGVVSLPAFAAESDKITATFHNNLQGLTYHEADQMITIDPAQLDMKSLNVQVNDYVGNVYLDEMIPGRTYYIQYGFRPVEGFQLPDKLEDGDVQITCEPGCSVYWYSITHGAENAKGVAFHTKVTVPGNFWQRLTGWIVDHVNRLLAWSPY